MCDNQQAARLHEDAIELAIHYGISDREIASWEVHRIFKLKGANPDLIIGYDRCYGMLSASKS
jgi:hypothetical protein